MNIFWLLEDMQDYEGNAKLLMDQHVVKMALEAIQVAYAVLYALDATYLIQEAPIVVNKKGEQQHGYKVTHKNHPITLWAGKCKANLLATLNHARAISNEYTVRYKKVHSVHKHIEWFFSIIDRIPFSEEQKIMKMTIPPACIPDEYKSNKPIALQYLDMYIHEKLKKARYYHTNPPFIFKKYLKASQYTRAKKKSIAKKIKPILTKSKAIKKIVKRTQIKV